MGRKLTTCLSGYKGISIMMWGSNMKKSLLWAVVGLVLMIASLAATKALQIGTLIQHGKAFVPPPTTVTSAACR